MPSYLRAAAYNDGIGYDYGAYAPPAYRPSISMGDGLTQQQRKSIYDYNSSLAAPRKSIYDAKSLSVAAPRRSIYDLNSSLVAPRKSIVAADLLPLVAAPRKSIVDATLSTMPLNRKSVVEANLSSGYDPFMGVAYRDLVRHPSYGADYRRNYVNATNTVATSYSYYKPDLYHGSRVSSPLRMSSYYNTGLNKMADTEAQQRKSRASSRAAFLAAASNHPYSFNDLYMAAADLPSGNSKTLSVLFCVYNKLFENCLFLN